MSNPTNQDWALITCPEHGHINRYVVTDGTEIVAHGDGEWSVSAGRIICQLRDLTTGRHETARLIESAPHLLRLARQIVDRARHIRDVTGMDIRSPIVAELDNIIEYIEH